MNQSEYLSKKNIGMYRDFVTPKYEASATEIYEWIMNGNVKDLILQIRCLYKEGKGEEADALKRTIPAFTASGLCKEKRVLKNLRFYSQYIMLDLDDLSPQQVAEAKTRAAAIPYTIMAFVSPSGYGLKIMVKVDSSLEHHKAAYAVAKKYYEGELGYECDKTDDATRLCFLSYDPDAFLNRSFETFPVDLQSAGAAAVANRVTAPAASNDSKEHEDLFYRAVKFTENKSQFQEGNRNNFVFQLACNCNNYGIPHELVCDLCAKRYETHDFDSKEISTIITSAYKKTEQFGTRQHVVPRSIPESISTDCELIPDSVYHNLPGILKSITSHFDSNHERDLILLSSLGSCSTMFPHIQGKYDKEKVGLNLFLFITASASAGKGVINWSRKLTLKIVEYLRKKYTKEYQKYLLEYNEYTADKKNNPGALPPTEPTEKHIVIPANTSSSMLIEMLYNNKNFGLMYETEADALVTTSKNDWGNISYIVRAAFHHEPISLARRGNNKEVKNVDRPHLSGVFSGTISSLKSFIPGVENGYFSRFMHYMFNAPIEWVDKFEDNGEDLGGIFDDYANQFLHVWQRYEEAENVTVAIQPSQRKRIFSFFNSRLHELNAIYGVDIVASVKRHALIAYRIAMLLTVLRQLTDGVELDQDIYVNDIDLETTLQITDVLFKHLTVVFSKLQGESNTNRFKTKKRTLFEGLPDIFTTDECCKLADELGIARKTAETYLKQLTDEGLLEHAERGKYRKKK